MASEAVLIVDDHSTNRLKMAAAVRNLGYEAAVVGGGREALDHLRARPCDAVLLDILMPGMDGFDVLRALKEDEALRDIPVIVVSALDDDTASVVRAIELGAEDFLPKDFDPVILRARLGTSLQKKRFRDQEREFRRLVGKLTEAAETLESQSLRPERLALDDIVSRQDPLGRLGRVFQSMAEEIYERERRLRRNIRMARGSLLVIAVGVSWGIIAPLSRMASGLDSDPLGLAVWTNLIGAAACLGVAAARGRLPPPTWPVLRFCLLWGIITGVLERLILFSVTGHVQATTVALICSLEGFMVFVVAAALRIEKASLRRLGGLLLGLLGAVLVIKARGTLSGVDEAFWLLMTASLPLLFSIEGLFVAARRPENVDVTALTGLALLASFAIILPVAAAAGELLHLGPAVGRLEVVVLLIALASVLAIVLWLLLVDVAGAVFASQTAYSITIAGIVWSMLLLDERLSPLAWGALALMLLGLYFVEPQASAADDEFRLPVRLRRAKSDLVAQARGEPHAR